MHIEKVGIMNIVEVVSKPNFSSLMDCSAFHGKEKEGVYIQSFQGEEVMKGENLTVTKLLKLPDVRVF